MLEALSIRDVVLIDKLDLEFGNGLCVLTGETGAGKSILLDAFSLALGGRGDAALVRRGANQGQVTALFALPKKHPVLALLAGPGGQRLQEIEAIARRRFFLVPAVAENGHVHLDHFEVQEQGKLEVLKPSAAVEEGASLELKLVEVGLYDPTAGVGKVDGTDVVVARAAKLVGKKVTVSVGRVLDGVAYAMLADTPEAATPITFEAEAEKPMRASRSKKEVSPADEPADLVTADVEVETGIEDGSEDTQEADVDGEVGAATEASIDGIGTLRMPAVAGPQPSGDAGARLPPVNTYRK